MRIHSKIGLLQSCDYSFIMIFVCVCILLIGSVYFIIDLCGDRFHTPIHLWVGGWLGIMGVVLAAWQRRNLIFRIPVFLIALYICWVCSWIFTSPINYYSISRFFVDNVLICLFFFYFSILGRHILSFFLLLVVLAGSVSLVGLLQLLGIFHSFHSVFIITGTFDNPAGISAILVILLPFTFYFFQVNNRSQRYLSYIICALMMIVIILSDARTAIFALIIISMGYFLKKKRLYIVCILLLLLLLYFMKPDSANGRLLIWRCCIQPILNNPLFGSGDFSAWYMLSQAHFFTEHPSEMWAVMLSDNIRHPFNEYLKVIVERGIVGFIPIIGIAMYSILSYCMCDLPEKKCAFWSLVAIAICSFFSYPFDYEIVKIVFVISFFILTIHTYTSSDRKTVKIEVHRNMVFLFSIILLINVFYQVYFDVKWDKLLKCENSLDPKTCDDYNNLYLHSILSENTSFLYNYSIVLHKAGYYDKSNAVLLRCSRKMNDYDVQLLQGYNFLKMNQVFGAKLHFEIASNMIPCRLVPLYELFQIYKTTGQYDLTLKMAQKIAVTPVKVVSVKTDFIKREADNYLKQVKKGGVL